jgi:circadian clock protein KaiC
MHKQIIQFDPRVVVIDPVTNLTEVGNVMEARGMLTRLVDFLKTRGITALFTSLSAGNNAEMTEVGISSLMDTWLLVRNLESNGERNRGLYVLKSRGMPHSNQIREFILSDRGAQLLDVYTGSAGVLTGTARMVQEERDKAEALMQRNEIKQKRRELARKKEEMEAQIAALRGRFARESSELQMLIAEEQLAEDNVAQQRKLLVDARSGLKNNGSPNGGKGATNGRQYQAGRDNGRKGRARERTT